MNETLEPVVSYLTQGVTKAQNALNSENTDDVKTEFYRWIDPDKFVFLAPDKYSDGLIELQLTDVAKKIDLLGTKPDNFNSYTWISLGVLGLTRILHVSTNAEIKAAKTGQSEINKNDLYTQLLHINIMYKLFRKSLDMPLTIHGNPIHWNLERAQDEGRTDELWGNKKAANEKFGAGINEARLLLRKRNNSDEEASIRSAMAVLQVRKGGNEDDQSLITRGLINQIRANFSLFNEQRTSDLGGMAAKRAQDTFAIDSQLAWRAANFVLGGTMYKLHAKN